ncbi:MAG: hypothetical protein R3D98_11315 [Candidatus Krumholzibacteriia bacterium]
MGTTNQLHVELHDGFSGEAVSAWLDGNEVWQTTGARTRLQIDLAAAFTVAVDQGRHRFEIRVPERDAILGLDIDIAGPWWIAVDLGRDGKLAARQSATAFRHA